MSFFTHTPRESLMAGSYPNCAAMIFSENGKRKSIKAVVNGSKLVKPYFLSSYKYMNRTVICSGTFHIQNEDTNPYLAILGADSTAGSDAIMFTDGDFWLPIHTSYTTETIKSTSLLGKTAYLVTEGENWGVTDDLDGQNGIIIGRFISRVHERPNGIKWGDRFAGVALDSSTAYQNSPITISENSDCGCDFGCRMSLFPFIEGQNGLNVTIESNIFVLNSGMYERAEIWWNFTGDTETVVDVNGNPFTRLKNERPGNNKEETWKFDDYGTYTVTITAFANKKRIIGGGFPDTDEDCGCSSCGGCCEIKEFQVIVSAEGAVICTPNVTPTGIRADYRMAYTYTDAASATADKVTGITLGGTAYSFTAAIAMTDRAAIETAIKGILTGKTLFDDVLVDYHPAPSNATSASLFIRITNVDSVLIPTSIQMDLNNGSSTPSQNFVAI